ncbi:enoyl-CoA hydratase [Algihabitans sp.]|uniref:enoyl-CoA hydratase n=1 Tax=Algihabitans sp. TaxID=2821514 RepID=UPI003BAC2468
MPEDALQPLAARAEEPPVLLRRESGGVVTLTLNRPKAYNALSEELLAALTQELGRIAEDDSQRVVVIESAGKAFCPGHDLKQMRATPEENYYRRLFTACSEMMLAIVRLPQPVIAKVHGLATAAGCQLVASCDLAVATQEARFATSGINAGLFCSTPAVALSRNVPTKPAFEMLVTGDFIDAEQARQWGLVNRVIPADQLEAAVEEMTGKIIAKSAVAVRMGKEMFYRQREKTLTDAYAYAAEVMACNMMAEDAGEGLDAFIEKRHPVWKNR